VRCALCVTALLARYTCVVASRVACCIAGAGSLVQVLCCDSEVVCCVFCVLCVVIKRAKKKV
jgi:hypothetical protein